MFIGRQAELNFLEERYNDASAQFVVLYGRRRLGKTELLRQFSKSKDCIFYTCTEIPDDQQLAAFSQRVLEKNPVAARYIKSFSSWEQAFLSLQELYTEKKLVVVIDEFPYMVRGNSSIPSLLQKLWDEQLRAANVMFIICGSAMSFMKKEILAEKNPLYGRATGILKLQEMDFYDAQQFFPSYTTNDKILAYAVLGGVPHYLKQFSDKLSISENIIRTVLTRGSVLYSEVEFLMRQELRETSVYNAIIEAVALGNTKLNDIHQKTQIEKSKLSVYLKNLLELGILCKEFSVDANIKEQANVQRGLYKVTDNFFRFWYAFVFPNISELEAGDAEGIYKYVVERELERYTSYVFEDVCQQYLRRQNRLHLLPFYFTKIGRWWNKTDEIDIMAVNYQKTDIILGECKYKQSVVDVKDLKHLQAKQSLNNKNICYYFFSKSGYTQSAREYARQEGMQLVTLEELL